MIRQARILSAAFLVLWGCASDKAMEGTKAAKEFATQKEGVCCFVGYRPLPDDQRPKVDQEKADLARQLEEAKAALAAKEQERADLARQLEAAKAAPAGSGDRDELARQLAAANAALVAKEQERAELARQLEAMKAGQAGPGDLARQLEEAKEKAKKLEAQVISLEEQLKMTNDLVMVKSEEAARLEGQLDAAKEAAAAKAAPVPVAKAAPAAKEGERVTAAELAKTLSETGAVALRNILFDTGKATIKPVSEKQLAEVGQLLKNDQALKLEIQGHTDNVGKKAFNQKLSQARAAAVKDYIVKKYGVAADRLTTAGFGFDKPVADNATLQGRALNRRVDLVKQ